MRKFQVETIKTDYPDEIISAGQLLRILDSDAREISALCQKACLKPKKDGFGNIYFSKGDVDILRKVKELYEYTKKLQEEKRTKANDSFSAETKVKENKLKKFKDENMFKQKAEIEINKDVLRDNFTDNKNFPVKSGLNKTEILSGSMQNAFFKRIDTVESNVIKKVTDLLSEKLDGLDEVIVELIKAKTENETLRQKVNELNKENFALKTENSSYKAVGLGFYIKKSTDELTF